MFRAIDMAQRGSSDVHKTAVPAIQHLIRRLTRQYETFSWAGEESKLWEWVAFLSWTHLVLTRVETEGYQWEAAFEREARARLRRSKQSSKSLAIRHPKALAKPTTNQLPRSDTASSHWFICPCCAAVNEHFSPACPTQAKGPSPIPKATVAKTKKLIEAAPISAAAKANLLRMTDNLVSKLNS